MDIELNEKQVEILFNFINLKANDIFYYLEYGSGKVVISAVLKRDVKKSVGIENNPIKLTHAKKELKRFKNQKLTERISSLCGDYSKKKVFRIFI